MSCMLLTNVSVVKKARDALKGNLFLVCFKILIK